MTWAHSRGLYFAGRFARLGGNDGSAEKCQREAASRLDAIGDRRSLVDCLDVLACIAARAGDPEVAMRLFTVGARIRATTGVARHRYLDAHAAPVEAAARASLGDAIAARVMARSGCRSPTHWPRPRPAPR